MTEQGLGLGAEYQLPLPDSPEQGLHPQPVPAEHQPSLRFIPDGNGKNTVEPAGKVRAILHIGIQNRLCVAGGLKGIAPPGQLRRQLTGVIDLSVVGDGIVPAVPAADHRLDAAGQVPDGEPGVGQPRRRHQILPGLVPAPVGQSLPHPDQHLCPAVPPPGIIFLKLTKACNSAHNSTSKKRWTPPESRRRPCQNQSMQDAGLCEPLQPEAGVQANGWQGKRSRGLLPGDGNRPVPPVSKVRAAVHRRKRKNLSRRAGRKRNPGRLIPAGVLSNGYCQYSAPSSTL